MPSQNTSLQLTATSTSPGRMGKQQAPLLGLFCSKGDVMLNNIVHRELTHTDQCPVWITRLAGTQIGCHQNSASCNSKPVDSLTGNSDRRGRTCTKKVSFHMWQEHLRSRRILRKHNNPENCLPTGQNTQTAIEWIFVQVSAARNAFICFLRVKKPVYVVKMQLFLFISTKRSLWMTARKWD